jgi:hypothetical protein
VGKPVDERNPATEFEVLLASLGGLARNEIGMVLRARVPCPEARRLADRGETLSSDALRLLAARAIWRHERGRLVEQRPRVEASHLPAASILVEETRLLADAQPLISDHVERGDRELLARIAAGELRALGELYDRYAADVWRAAQRSLRDAEDVEHVVYDTFVSLPRLAEEYDARASCRTWLRALAVLRAKRRNRSARRLFVPLRAWCGSPKGVGIQ